MRFCRHLVFILPLSLSLGCGSSGTDEQMVPVSGVITLNGKPLANAEVNFMSGQLGGYGKTDDQGHFRLVNGAPVGVNKVYITKGDPNHPNGAVGKIDPALDEGQLAEMQKHQRGNKPKPALPVQFSDPQKTKLTFNVPNAGSEAANFDL